MCVPAYPKTKLVFHLVIQAETNFIYTVPRSTNYEMHFVSEVTRHKYLLGIVLELCWLLQYLSVRLF